MNRRKKFVLMGALAAGIAASFAAWAIPYPKAYHEVVVSYYGSDDYSELVGVQSYQGTGCEVFHSSWGTATQYRQIEILPCPQP